MAKRFTDSLKYRKHFFRSLPGAYKLFYDFLYHDCDHAGIWIVDIETAQIFVGKDMPIQCAKALELFNSDEARIIPFDGGKKWFIPLFIKFQYGRLSEKNRAHTAVIEVLRRYELIDENLNIIEKISPIKENPKPLWEVPKGDKDMVKEQEQDMDKEKEEGGMGETLDPNRLVGGMIKIFKESYPEYPVDIGTDPPNCAQIAYKIAKAKGWTKESVTNGKLSDVLLEWRSIVTFSKSDAWFSTRAISDFNKEFQRIIQKITNGGAANSKRLTETKPQPRGDVASGGFGQL